MQTYAEGPTVVLRDITANDVPALHLIYGNEAVTEYLSFQPKDLAGVQTLVDGIVARASAEPRTEYALAIVRKDDLEGDLIGMLRLALEPHRTAQIGFALRPDQWQQGIGFEAVSRAISFAFRELNIHRVWAARDPLNVASAKLLEKVGMTDEGTIRDHVEIAPGEFRDSISAAILENEWKKSSS